MENKKSRWSFLSIVSACVFAIVIIFVAAAFSPADSSDSVSRGEEGYLRSSTGKDLVVLRTKSALDEYTDASIANDDYGAALVIYRGEGFFVPSGTKVLVIGSGVAVREVRVLDGEQIMQSGWVPMEWVVSQ